MKLLTAKSRITIGLACLLVSVLCTAVMLGMVPDPASGVLAGRAHLCETIAVASSDYISRKEFRRLKFLLQTVVERNPDVLSAGLRRETGQVLVQIGNHRRLWNTNASDRSTDTHVHVPIRAGADRWGSVELRFRPLRAAGFTGWLEQPWVQLTLFVTSVSYLLFFVYLRKMLEHLDPSKTVPTRVRAALDTLAEGLLVVDNNDRIVLANTAFADWVDRDPNKLIGVKASSVGWTVRGPDQPLRFPWRDAIRERAPQAAVMMQLERPDRSQRTLMANASPVLGHDGKYGGVLVSFDDVTQLEQTKKELDRAKQVAEDANRAKSDFLARMSHEIRTPMNAILGYTDVLRRGFDQRPGDREEYLNTIHASGEHLLALINDILDLSKIEAGRLELELDRHSPVQVVQQVVSVLRVKAEEKGIYLRMQCDGPIPETIQTDAVRLRQAIMNLAGNAIKFTDKGGVTIRLRMVGDNGKSQLAIDVQDTGIGISSSAQAKIFDPFAQADTSITRRYGGTGLGLAISRQLAEALGGRISLQSTPNEGSVFTVTVATGPLDDVSMLRPEDIATHVGPSVSTTHQTIRLQGARILVADDGMANRKLVQLVLSRTGAEVIGVENGEQAVDQALSSTFDLILMDMQMPIMDGYTATRTLRDRGYAKPIVALTAHAMEGDEEQCRSVGCTDFLTKPINIDVLLTTLVRILGDLPERDDDDEAINDGQYDDVIPTSTSFQGTASMSNHEPEKTVSNAAKRDHADNRSPLNCSLPLEDPDFMEIAQDFVERLDEQLTEMDEALASGDMEYLARLAHWLKGSGGTAGFDQFTEIARSLERAAREETSQQAERHLQSVRALANRIELPAQMKMQ